MNKHLNLFFPQWQGSGKTKDLLIGGRTILESGLIDTPIQSISVSEEESPSVKENILGYDFVIPQLNEAKETIATNQPKTIFTIGGGCDIEIAPISYLNEQYEGDLTVLWIDAHGDLNTPESSESKTFHGMPLRILMENTTATLDKIIPLPLKPSQVMLIGQRDLDVPEADFIKENKLTLINDIDTIENSPEKIIDLLKAGYAKNIYLHIDLDVLDVEEFPDVLVPVAGGISITSLLTFVDLIRQNFSIAGMGVVEFTGEKLPENNLFAELLSVGCSL